MRVPAQGSNLPQSLCTGVAGVGCAKQRRTPFGPEKDKPPDKIKVQPQATKSRFELGKSIDRGRTGTRRGQSCTIEDSDGATHLIEIPGDRVKESRLNNAVRVRNGVEGFAADM